MSVVNNKQQFDFVRLARSTGIGIVRLKEILSHHTPSEAVAKWVRSELVIPKNSILADKEIIQQEFDDSLKYHATCLTLFDPDYPIWLRECHDAPAFLWVLGNIKTLSQKSCAIIGSRNASVGGRKIAYSLAKSLAEKNIITISGMALGIDAAAHQGGLSLGTIAVLAGGVDKIYPPEHHGLYHDILKNNGAIISEFPFGTQPIARLFPRRNRIISGLSWGVVVVEANLKSGSLTTAEQAAAQNKQVFAVPGSPLDARSAGTNYLLRNGAAWAESSLDILDYLEPMQNLLDDTPLDFYLQPKNLHLQKEKTNMVSDFDQHTNQQAPAPLNTTQAPKNFLDYFSDVPISLDEIIRLSGESGAKILQKITLHELGGDIERQSGNMFLRIPKRL